ncbi:hypothetical protein MMC13_002375 [Lambiella insularis]|nr:hypothetical protein [Lambiella insularis]
MQDHQVLVYDCKSRSTRIRHDASFFKEYKECSGQKSCDVDEYKSLQLPPHVDEVVVFVDHKTGGKPTLKAVDSNSRGNVMLVHIFLRQVKDWHRRLSTLYIVNLGAPTDDYGGESKDPHKQYHVSGRSLGEGLLLRMENQADDYHPLINPTIITCAILFDTDTPCYSYPYPPPTSTPLPHNEGPHPLPPPTSTLLHSNPLQILASQSATLTNHEVLSHLHSLSSRRAQPNSKTPAPLPTPSLKAPNYETILKELTEYLSTSPLPTYAAPFYSAAATRTLLQRLKPYHLTKAETLMVLNLRPRDLGLLDCVVEECDERFSEEQQEAILRIVGEVLGGGERAREGVGEAA